VARVVSLIAGITLLFTVAGCRKKHVAPHTPTTALSPLTIAYATVTRAKAEPPARFFAPLPLPSEFDQFNRGDARFPPSAHVTDLLAAGDADMQRRWLTALRQAVKQGAGEVDLRKTWGRMFEFRRAPALCAFAERHAVGEQPAAVRALFWELLAPCDDAAAAALLARKDAPGRALIVFARERRAREQPAPPYSKVMADAAARIITSEPDSARMTAFALAELGDARAVEQLLRLHGVVNDGRTRHDVAMALMIVRNDPRAQAIARAACAGGDRDPMCNSKVADAAMAKPPAAAAAPALDGLATAQLVDVGQALGGRRDAEAVAALDACARRNPRGYIKRQCLEHLALIDRARAVQAAATIVAGADDPDTGELLATLARWPDAAQLDARLRAAGLDAGAADGGASDATLGLTVRGRLQGTSRLHSFDAETGSYPNEHDSLLRALARLASPRFPPTVFQEMTGQPGKQVTVDSEEYPDDDAGPYTLVAYTGGQRLQTTAANYGDWYDVTAVLGLLNVIARDAGLETRFASLATTDQIAHVVALPERALRGLADAGLLLFDGGDEARASGREVETRALEQLGAR
jgi:hypothetical protein